MGFAIKMLGFSLSESRIITDLSDFADFGVSVLAK